MSSNLILPPQKNTQNRRTWHGRAFTVEALLIMVFIVVSIAVLFQLFTMAQNHASTANELSYATILASNEAERFASSPSEQTVQYFDIVDEVAVPLTEPGQDSFMVLRNVLPSESQNGTLYQADIIVERHGSIVYRVSSARYVSTMGVGS